LSSGGKKESGHYCELAGENQGDPWMDIDALSLKEEALFVSYYSVKTHIWKLVLLTVENSVVVGGGSGSRRGCCCWDFIKRILNARDVITTTTRMGLTLAQ
jgi:hypothetical protein